MAERRIFAIFHGTCDFVAVVVLRVLGQLWKIGYRIQLRTLF
jgi:hypothetical protein